MFNDDLTRLRHMRDAAQKAVRFAQNKTRDALETDEMLTLSLVKCIEIIGEAASRVTRERQLEWIQIPWAQIVGMRNRLIHAYFQIDLDIVWNTVTQALPSLILDLESIIQNEEQK
ncbi:HepT-like ribonuclease domain-containing protein [Phormidesmis priestleyi]